MRTVFLLARGNYFITGRRGGAYLATRAARQRSLLRNYNVTVGEKAGKMLEPFRRPLFKSSSLSGFFVF